MSDLDELFRQGLSGRKPEVPSDLWNKISTSKGQLPPQGDALDRLFAERLGARQAAVPPDMWSRITAARRPVIWWRYAVAFLLLLTASTFWLLPTKTTSGAGPQVETPPEMQKTATATPTPDPTAATIPEAAHPTSRLVPAKVYEEVKVAPMSSAHITGPFQSQRSLSSPSRSSEQGSRKISRTTATTALTPLPPTPLELADRLPSTGPVRAPEKEAFRASGRHRLQGELLLGAAYADQRFGVRQAGVQQQRSLREVSEFPALSHQFSARLRYRLGGPWQLLTGVTYLGIRNRFEYERRSGGQTELVRHGNRINLFEVPLLASYELPGRRLRVGLNAGPVLNALTTVRGSYLRPTSLDPSALDQHGQYRRRIGLGWTASLTTTYTIGRQQTVQLLLEPFFKHYPGSFTVPDAALSERYWVAGLQLGLRKSL